MLGVNHGERSSERTTVDEHVEVDVDSCCGNRRVDDFFLSALGHAHISLGVFVLLGNERRNVGLEAPGSNTHDDQTDGKDAKRRWWVDNDRRDGRDDENNVTDNGDDVGILNGQVAAPVLVSEIRSEKGSQIRPKLVDCRCVNVRIKGFPPIQTYTGSFRSKHVGRNPKLPIQASGGNRHQCSTLAACPSE